MRTIDLNNALTGTIIQLDENGVILATHEAAGKRGANGLRSRLISYATITRGSGVQRCADLYRVRLWDVQGKLPHLQLTRGFAAILPRTQARTELYIHPCRDGL